MIPLSFSLSFRNLKRNKRNTFSIAIGIFLTLALLSAINFNLNLSRNEIIQQSSGIDFNIYGTYSNGGSSISNFLADNQTWQKIATEPEITSVTPYTLGYRSFYNQSSGLYYNYDIFGVQQSYLDNLRKSGELTAGSGTLSINKTAFNDSIPVIGIKTAGINITFESQYFFQNPSYNLSKLTVVGWVNVDLSKTIFAKSNINFIDSNQQYLTFITYFPIVNSIIADQGNLVITVKNQYINLDNLDQTSSTYTKIVQKLNLKYPNYNFFSNVATSIFIANAIITIFQGIVTIFLVPFIFIALYISYLASRLNLESRRIQYGLFLSRGGKATIISWSYRFEGVLIGGFCGLLTFILNPITGYILHYWIPSITLTASLQTTVLNFFVTQYSLTPWFIGIGALIGFFIMYIPSYYSYLNPKALLEAHRVEESDPAVKGSRDVLFLMIGLSPFFVAIAIIMMNDLHAPIILTILILGVSSIVLYVVPFSPFLITYGMAAYFSRQPFLLQIVTNTYSKAVPDLKEVLDKTIRSKSNNLTRIAFVIAFAFTFIIVPLVASASLQNYSTKTQTFQIGSDMAITSYDPSLVNETTIHQLSYIKSTTTIQVGTFKSLSLIYINATTYIKTANFKSYWNVTPSALTHLNQNSILVNEYLLKTYNINVGDSFLINDVNYKIEGIFGAIGGTDYYSTGIPMILFNQNPSNNSSVNPRLLIKFNNPANLTNVNDAITFIRKHDPNASIMTLAKISNNTGQFNFLQFILNIIEIQAYLLLFLGLFALGFLMIIRIKERSRELGNWRSRGLGQSQLRRLITFELLILSTFGFLIGLLCSGIITFMVQYILLNYNNSLKNIIPFDFILPLNIINIVIIYIIGTFILSLFLNYWTFHMKISKQLRYEEYMR